jgi:SulP family sulfate permease
MTAKKQAGELQHLLLMRAKQEVAILILRVRKVLTIDATGLQALEDLHHKLRSKEKHLILSALHTQPLYAMENAGFIDRSGRENVCTDTTEALARARRILGLPPVADPLTDNEALNAEKRELEAVRNDLFAALERSNRALKRSTHRAHERNEGKDEAA